MSGSSISTDDYNELLGSIKRTLATAEGRTRGALQSMIADRSHERSQPALITFDRAVPEPDRQAVRQAQLLVQLVDDHLRNRERDDTAVGLLLVVGRGDVTVEVALRRVSTPLAVTEWRRLPAKVRQAPPSAEDLSATVSRTFREVESTATAALPEQHHAPEEKL